MGETVKDYVQTTREPLPNGRPNGRGAGVREPAAGQKTGRAPPERPHPHPVALRATRPLPVGLPDSHMSASRSSLPPLGEAEWRGGVGVGGGWARRAGDEDDAAVGPGQPSTPAPDRRRSASGKRPHPARASPESALPAARFASGRREAVRPADLQCVNTVAHSGEVRGSSEIVVDN